MLLIGYGNNLSKMEGGREGGMLGTGKVGQLWQRKESIRREDLEGGRAVVTLSGRVNKIYCYCYRVFNIILHCGLRETGVNKKCGGAQDNYEEINLIS